jgi:thiol-disulfide isomerase/thioredoxin
MADDLDLQAEPEGLPAAPPSRWRAWARDAAIFLVSGVLLLAVVGALRAPELPDTAPPLALSSLNGQVVDLAALRGRTVVLNFWATWCGPCRVELPVLTSFAASHPEVEVYYVAADGTVEDLRAFARRHDMPEDHVLRTTPGTQGAWGVTTLPTTVVVAPDGSVRAAHTGIVLPMQLWWWARGA